MDSEKDGAYNILIDVEKRTTDAEKKERPMLERLEKKKSKKLWILKKDYSKMKLVSCFRGLDCLSLRHLDNEKPTTIF